MWAKALWQEIVKAITCYEKVTFAREMSIWLPARHVALEEQKNAMIYRNKK